MNKSALTIGSTFAVAWVGCATPQELVDARSTYQRVSSGPTAQLNPTGLAGAKDALDRAEDARDREFRSGAYYTRAVSDIPDLAYIAMRKAQIAEVEANATLAANEKARLNKELEQKALARKERGDAENRARLDAEKRAADAAASLANIASVKQEARGTVLTLAGNVVFASGQYALRKDALPKLDKVAAALRELGGKTFLVEGHTDSVGSDELNQALSVKRAQSVSDYLVHLGISSQQIKAVGLGKSRPIADNETAQGRATNRRVEIVVQSDGG